MWRKGKILKFHNLLLQWYDSHKRELPWRGDPAPYRVWVSEVMLQQTQVKTVLPYYARFLERFPDIPTLAHAKEQEVLELWAGLGYYHRARSLHRAAKQIVEKFDAGFPDSYEAILQLPGIGKYTAGAICSIAFNQPQAAVDGNVKRLISRLDALQRPAPDGYFWRRAAAWIPATRISDFNQAIMELGALVCTPAHPRCSDCPVSSLCVSRNHELLHKVACLRPPRRSQQLEMALLVVRRGGYILISRMQSGYIPGIWGLPNFVIAAGAAAELAGRRFLSVELGLVTPLEAHGKVRHAISHRRITAHVFSARFQGNASLSGENYRWVKYDRVERLLTSSMFRKALRLTSGEHTTR